MNYRELVRNTMNQGLSDREKLANIGLGLAGEAGEVADVIKKHLMQGHELDRAKLLKELGDCCWYIEYAALVLGTNVINIIEMNAEKLKARYPNGFSTEASVNRPGKEL